MKVYWWYFVYLNVIIINTLNAACNRKPQGASGDRSPVDENFQILIDGNPLTFIPGQQYNISLTCNNNLKFISFTLVVESENVVLGALPSFDMMGHFEIIDAAETKFNLMCENMIEGTNTNTKSRIDVAWVAPTNPESGCVLIKATVLQHRNVWHSDDGGLTKRICAEEIDEINSQTPPVNPCCACDEAKYEIILERRWSRNTHAKDFPAEAWRTRFSEIIGASHTFDYHFWEYGSRASPGLQEMAEHGSTRTLEEEIKANTDSGSIRTIIKAPGIIHRNNVMGTTMAKVRVDPTHHVVSLVSKIDPSPDWIVGVAGLELCLMNCTWIDQKVLNLYPWDIGTDGGPSYMSSDQPQIPPDVVRRITSTYPSDKRSPFYDESGAPMKPLATLYITKKKLYERDCEFAERSPLECLTHPWNNWNDCSSKCGPGTQYRVRAFKDSRLAESFNCEVELSQTQNCMGNQCGLTDDGMSRTPAAECELSQWSSWSACSKRCGQGFTTRTREFLNAYSREKCQSGIPISLEQKRDCSGQDCGGTIRGGSQGMDELEQQPEFGNLDEPGLFEENSPFEVNRFQPNLRPQNAGRFGNRNRNRVPELTNEREDDPFDNRKNQESFDHTRPTQFQGRPKPTRPNFSNQPTNNEESIPQENIYGSEQLVGKPNQAYEQEEDQETIEENPYQGNINQGNQRTQRPSIQSNFNQQSVNTNQNRFATPANNRFQTNSPPIQYKGNRYSANSMNSAYNSNLNNNNNQFGNRPQFDEFGQKIVNEEEENLRDQVFQRYCVERPRAKVPSCRKNKIELKNFWFHDVEDGQCKLFTSDTCDESLNRFTKLENCERTCVEPQRNDDQNKNQLQYEEEGRSNSWNAGFGQPQSQTRPRNWAGGRRNQKQPMNSYGWN